MYSDYFCPHLSLSLFHTLWTHSPSIAYVFCFVLKPRKCNHRHLCDYEFEISQWSLVGSWVVIEVLTDTHHILESIRLEKALWAPFSLTLICWRACCVQGHCKQIQLHWVNDWHICIMCPRDGILLPILSSRSYFMNASFSATCPESWRDEYQCFLYGWAVNSINCLVGQ